MSDVELEDVASGVVLSIRGERGKVVLTRDEALALAENIRSRPYYTPEVSERLARALLPLAEAVHLDGQRLMSITVAIPPTRGGGGVGEFAQQTIETLRGPVKVRFIK